MPNEKLPPDDDEAVVVTAADAAGACRAALALASAELSVFVATEEPVAPKVKPAAAGFAAASLLAGVAPNVKPALGKADDAEVEVESEVGAGVDVEVEVEVEVDEAAAVAAPPPGTPNVKGVEAGVVAVFPSAGLLLDAPNVNPPLAAGGFVSLFGAGAPNVKPAGLLLDAPKVKPPPAAAGFAVSLLAGGTPKVNPPAVTLPDDEEDDDGLLGAGTVPNTGGPVTFETVGARADTGTDTGADAANPSGLGVSHERHLVAVLGFFT